MEKVGDRGMKRYFDPDLSLRSLGLGTRLVVGLRE